MKWNFVSVFKFMVIHRDPVQKDNMRLMLQIAIEYDHRINQIDGNIV